MPKMKGGDTALFYAIYQCGKSPANYTKPDEMIQLLKEVGGKEN